MTNWYEIEDLFERFEELVEKYKKVKEKDKDEDEKKEREFFIKLPKKERRRRK